MDDDWRRWIAENLMIGLSADDIFTTMIASGFARAEAAHEINLAIPESLFPRVGAAA